MNYEGVLIGLASFFIIGVFHPIIIKGEYYFSKKIWPIFLILGAVFVYASLTVEYIVWAALLGVLGFTCWWSIIEIFEQEHRVKKGWFPANPKRDYGNIMKSPMDSCKTLENKENNTEKENETEKEDEKEKEEKIVTKGEI